MGCKFNPCYLSKSLKVSSRRGASNLRKSAQKVFPANPTLFLPLPPPFRSCRKPIQRSMTQTIVRRRSKKRGGKEGLDEFFQKRGKGGGLLTVHIAQGRLFYIQGWGRRRRQETSFKPTSFFKKGGGLWIMGRGGSILWVSADRVWNKQKRGK